MTVKKVARSSDLPAPVSSYGCVTIEEVGRANTVSQLRAAYTIVNSKSSFTIVEYKFSDSHLIQRAAV